MSTTPTQDLILESLKGIVTPEQIDTVAACDGIVKINVILASTADPNREALFAKIQETVSALPDIKQVQVQISLKTPAAKPTFGAGAKTPSVPAKGQENKANVKHIIAISSGKGGVGKTTVSVNLACALQQAGHKVGILDADVYGPNVPIMMGLRGAKMGQDPVLNKLEVPVNHGVQVVSIGFLVPEEQPVVWRGPMLDKIIRQFLTDTKWDDVDYLLIDLPPGTGDAQLTVIQAMPVTGAVIVTTPQEVALHDSKKGLAMFQQAEIPVFGIIENMSYFMGDDGKRYEIFGHGGGQIAAEKLGVPFLGEIPLVSAQREQADIGMPIVVSEPDSPQAQIFKQIAANLTAQIAQLPPKNTETKTLQPA